MSKDIKTKNSIKDIKSIDKAAIAGERIRIATAKTKDRFEEQTDTQYDSPHEYATSQVSSHAKHYTNKTVVETKIQSQKIHQYAKYKIKTRKEKQKVIADDEIISESGSYASSARAISNSPQLDSSEVEKPQIRNSKIKTKEPVQKDIKSTDRKSKKGLKKSDKSAVKSIQKGGKSIKETSKMSIKTSQEIAKQSVIKSVKTSKESYHTVKELGRKSINAVKKTANAAKRTIEATRTAIAFICSIGWIAILIILLIALIGGVFMTGSSNNGEGNQLSTEVIAHTATLQKYANEYEIPHFLNALQAIMMQESGGKGNDPMQASECPFNKKFPNIPNGITNPDYSIKVGVQNFAECLKQSNCIDPLDIPSLSLALQGYNFGNGYIDWALKNFGAYSQGNAKVFSDEQAHKHGWSNYGDPEYVPHVLRYYQFSGIGASGSKLVDIATSQIGNQGGTPYWSWYGYKERVEWCACFISWVAYQSGDLDITIPKFAAVVDGVKWYRDKGKWQDRNYIPKSGDIIFFDWEQDGTPDHVGIVEKVEDGIIYTIEGNSNDQCRKKAYTLKHAVIYGYGVNRE